MSWVANTALLNDGRLHLQQGPIDLIIEAFADDPREVASAYEQASMRFSGLLQELVDELPVLRSALTQCCPRVHGPVARQMVDAAWPYRDEFITPMAAVAGAVAEAIMAAMLHGRKLRRAYVNNGGDIAFHLAGGEQFRIGIAEIDDGSLQGVGVIDATMPIRGVATSGWRGRSFSFGIADSVTVLAATAAEADVAATMIANAVNMDHLGIRRVAANSLHAESDLGSRLVTRDVPMLDERSIALALDNGVAKAQKYLERELLQSAVIRLQGHSRSVAASDTILHRQITRATMRSAIGMM